MKLGLALALIACGLTALVSAASVHGDYYPAFLMVRALNYLPYTIAESLPREPGTLNPWVLFGLVFAQWMAIGVLYRRVEQRGKSPRVHSDDSRV